MSFAYLSICLSMNTRQADITLERDMEEPRCTTTDGLDVSDLGYGTTDSTGSNEVSHDEEDTELTGIAHYTPTYPPDPHDFDETDCILMWDGELRDWIFRPNDSAGPTANGYVRLHFSPDEWLDEYIRFCNDQW